MGHCSDVFVTPTGTPRRAKLLIFVCLASSLVFSPRSWLARARLREVGSVCVAVRTQRGASRLREKTRDGKRARAWRGRGERRRVHRSYQAVLPGTDSRHSQAGRDSNRLGKTRSEKSWRRRGVAGGGGTEEEEAGEVHSPTFVPCYGSFLRAILSRDLL